MKIFNLLKRLKTLNKSSQATMVSQSTSLEPNPSEPEAENIRAPFAQDTTTISLEKAIHLYKPDFTTKYLVMSREDLRKHILYAVAIGDISGSQYEGVPYPGQDVQEILSSKRDATTSCSGAYPVYEGYRTIDLLTEFNHITDDTILTIAIYKATQQIKVLNLTDENEIVNLYTKYLHKYHHSYPNAGYAGGFDDWAWSETTDRNYSYGNGSCMRVGGIAVLFDDVEEVIRYAYYSALPSHSHKEGIKGAICTAIIYWMLAHGASKNDIIRYLEKTYPNDGRYPIHAHTHLEDLVNMNRVNPWSTLSVICQTSVTEAVINFLESDSFESCIRNSYRYLCDRDTIAAISGPMAAIYYKDMTVQGFSGEDIVKTYFDEKLWNDIHS